MAFTKIAAAGIGSTELVTLHSLEVLNNATVGGVLTYEDVTNVDSVGLITARNGIVVGSGITLSKDGDIFFTGIATGNGSGLTNLATDLVNDTSPQLGGDLDTNSFEISLDDSHAIKFGDDTDFTIAHDGSNARLINTTGNLILFPKTGEYSVVCVPDGAVELYHDNIKVCETDPNGLKILGPEGGEAEINLFADEGDDNADKWRIQALAAGGFNIQNFTSGSWEDNLKATGDGAVELYYDNSKKFETTSSGITVTGSINASGLSKASGNMFINNNDTSNGIITFATNTNDRWKIDFSGHFVPANNNDVNIGSSSKRVANIYTNDLHLSNVGHTNDVDGTWGDWTIQEGESDLFLKNNRSGKKYKFNLTEVS